MSPIPPPKPVPVATLINRSKKRDSDFEEESEEEYEETRTRKVPLAKRKDIVPQLPRRDDLRIQTNTPTPKSLHFF